MNYSLYRSMRLDLFSHRQWRLDFSLFYEKKETVPAVWRGRNLSVWESDGRGKDGSPAHHV